MFGLGWPELIVIFLILVLLFGASKLPKLSRSAGESVSQFKKGMNSGKDDDKKSGDSSS